jgi:hypothetical protein
VNLLGLATSYADIFRKIHVRATLIYHMNMGRRNDEYKDECVIMVKSDLFSGQLLLPGVDA